MMPPAQAIAALGGPEAARAKLFFLRDFSLGLSAEEREAVAALAVEGLEAQQAPSDAEIEAWHQKVARALRNVFDASMDEVYDAVALMRRGRARDELRASLREVLYMLAMVPEAMLSGLRIDPYGTIGDALEVLGESRDPDAWRALHRMAGLPDPGPEPACGGCAAVNDGEASSCHRHPDGRRRNTNDQR